MKVRFDCSLDAWLITTVEADSYDAALEKLKGMTFEDLLEEGFIKDFDLDDIEGEVIEKTLKVKAYDIEYDIEEDDFEDKEEYIKLLNSLPNEVVVEITVDEDLPQYHLSEEDLIADEISYLNGGHLVKDFKYVIIEEK